MVTLIRGRRFGHRRSATVAVALAATMALVGAACTPGPPPADADVVLLASQQPDGFANYQNVTVPNHPWGGVGVFAAGNFIEVVSAEQVVAIVVRPFSTLDGWWIDCSGPSIDNGDGSFSCAADLEYLQVGPSPGGVHGYEGQGLLTTWPDAEPRFAAYLGNATTYAYSIGIGGFPYIDPTRVGQTWAEELRFQDGDDTVPYPPT